MSRTQEELAALFNATTAAMLAAYEAGAESVEIEIGNAPVYFGRSWETMIEPEPILVKITVTPTGAGYYLTGEEYAP